MASIIPVAAQALALFQTANTIASVFDNSEEKSQDLALSQLQQRQTLDQRQAAQDAAAKKAELQIQSEKIESERRNSLKRAVARQRAATGGQGISNGDGSSEAVLLGLFEESDAERATRERLDKLKSQSIDQSLLNKTSVNTLQRTQLAERQKLSSSSDLDDVSRLLSVF